MLMLALVHPGIYANTVAKAVSACEKAKKRPLLFEEQ